MARDVLYGLTFVGKDQLSPTLSKLSSEAKKADQAFDGLEKQSAKLRISGAGVATGLAAVGAAAAVAVASVVKLGQGMFALADSAAKVEEIEIRTLAAIRGRQAISDEEFESLKRLNTERERTLGIDADAQLQLQGTLAALGVHKNQLDAATKATIGLSNATGQGLNEASRVVAKVLAGNTAALQEYGIKVGSVGAAQEEFARLFDVVIAKSGTYGTKVQALTHSWEGLGEAFGKLIISNPDVLRTLDSIIGGITKMTSAVEEGGQKAKGYQQIVSTAFNLLGVGAQASAKLISNAIKAFNLLVDSPGLRKMAKDLDQSVIEMQNIAAGGTGREQQTAAESAAETYLEALQAAEFYRNALKELSAEQAAGRLTADEATEAFKVNAFEIAAAERKMRELEEWARKTHGTLNILGSSATRAAREIRQVGEAARMKPTSPGATRVTSAGAAPKEAAPSGFDEAFLTRMRKRAQLERDAAQMRGELLARLEQENQQRIADIQESFYVAQQEREQLARESAAAAAERKVEEVKAFFTNIGTSMVSIFSDAFSSIGRLQNETTTEIVRNEEGMLEERTRITKQYVQTAGGALKQFLGDAANMFFKAAIHQVAVLAIEAAAGALAKAFGTFGLAALVIGPALAGAAYAMVKASSSRIPPPPKFHVGGRVPGPMGQERLAVLQGGERVTSVADTVDNRGGGGGITINNNLLVAPSRVQVERVNRDVLMPSARRLQRLGFAG